MVAFAEGLVTDPKQAPMLHGLTESMLKSKYKGESILSINSTQCIGFVLFSISINNIIRL